jgi:hypothetical protein
VFAFAQPERAAFLSDAKDALACFLERHGLTTKTA